MEIPRARFSLTRLTTVPILAVIVTGLTVQSIAAFASFTRNADIRDLAGSIEEGVQPDLDYLPRFVATNGLDRASNDCGDAFTRARLTVSLAALDGASRGDDLTAIDAAEKNALDAAGRRLSCNPLDGNAWLRFAIVTAQASGPSGAAVEALRLSYWAAPNESWVIEARLPFATRLYLAGAKGFESEYLDDLRNFAMYEPTTRVAATYVATEPRVRTLLHPLIARQAEKRKKEIVAEIDRLGMLFDAE